MHAIVTGGNKGIGKAVTDALTQNGYTVTSLSRSNGCDVTNPDDVASAISSSIQQRGVPFVLVNNAGQAEGGTLEETSLEMWNRLIAVNMTGTFLCTQAVLPHMKQAGQGRIINVASTAGLRGAARISAYAATKHGVVGFTRAMAMELARTGITVNAVCPTYVDTEMTDRTIAAVSGRLNISREEALKKLERAVPIGRLIKPEEVAAAVLYLCSDAAGGITGQAIAVDGGETQ